MYGEIKTKLNIERKVLFNTIIRIYPKYSITQATMIVNKYMGVPHGTLSISSDTQRKIGAVSSYNNDIEKSNPKAIIPNVGEISKQAYTFYNEDMIRSMDWRHFEKFIERLFINAGYSTILTPPKWDKGKDIVATKNGITYFIECKHWNTESVGREYLQKLVGAAAPYNVNNVIFITTSRYHDNAILYAKAINKTNLRITLWGMKEILIFANMSDSRDILLKGKEQLTLDV